MNPMQAEQCLRDYLAGVAGIDGIVPVHTGASSEDIDLDNSVIVAEAGDVEHTSGFLYLVTATVAMRTPATAVTLAEHSARWSLITTALEDIAAMSASFAVTIAANNFPIEFAGRYVTAINATTEDRSWIASAEMALGIAEILP